MKKKPIKPKSALALASPWVWIIMVFTFILYANTLRNGYVLDDAGVLKENWVVKRGVEAIPTLFKTPYRYGAGILSDQLYRPLSLAMFAIEWQIAPGNPAVSHFLNLLFYALACGLLYLLLRRIFNRFHPLLALFACLLWVTHPIHTEVVANIKSRDEIMSAFFLFLSIYLFLDFLDKDQKLHLAGAIFAYFLAFLSKEGVATFVVLFPLIGWYFSSAEKKRILTGSALMLIPAAIYFLIRQSVLNTYNPVPAEISVTDNLLVAAPDLLTRLATAILILGQYLLKLIFPVTLVSDYSYNEIPITGWSDPLVILSFLIYAAATVYAFWKIRSRSPLIFGILFFLVTMSIYSNLLIMIGSSFAERFLFLPSLGFAIAASWLVLKAFRIKTDEAASPTGTGLVTQNKGPWILIALVLVLYAYRTVIRNAEWESERTLFSKDVTRSPNSAHMHLYWGLTLRDEGKASADQANFQSLMGQALKEFNTAISIYPKYADAYGQAGLAYYRLGDNEKALKNYEQAIMLDPANATFYSNQGIIYFNKGDIQKAHELYKKSVTLDPNYGDGYMNLGSTYGMMGKYEEAIRNFMKALEYMPDNARLYYFIGISYQSLNRPDDARNWLEKAYEKDPGLRGTKVK